MSWGKIYCDTNWGENKYRTAGSIINEATPDCFQFPEFVSFKDHVRSEGATYEKMQCGIDILLFLGRSISITPQSPLNPTFSGILDTYTGATAGYSTRRLTNTYTGGLIRVRRSSDDAEQDIGYDANGEDMDIFGLLAFVGTSGTDNGYVTTWYDQTGNGNHATNSTASEQPLIVSGGSIIYEGATISRPAIEFDGVNDHFTLNTPISVPQSDFFITDVVTKISTGFTAPYGANSSDKGLAYPRSRAILEGQRLTTNTSVIDWCGAQGIYTIQGISNSYTPYENGTARGTALSVTGAYTIKTMMVRRASDLLGITGGKVQERIIFLSNQSGNRTGIEGNIDNFFRITS